MSRGVFKRTALAVGAVGAMVATTFITTDSVRASGTGVEARSADAFVDSIGVNTHWHYGGTPYKEATSKLQQLLVDSGIRHQRDYPVNMSAITDLADRGVKTSAIIAHPDQGSWGVAIWDMAFDNLRSAPDAFASIEGTNEPDITMGSDWGSKMRTHQKTIWERVQADPSLRQIPVAAPSITWAHNAAELGDVSAWADFGNVHPYPGGRTPDKRVSEDIAASQRYNVGSKPVIATETGYHNMVPSNTGHPGTSEAAEAVYMPRMFLHYFDIGVPRTYAYEFVDSRDEAHAEGRFGMVRHDLTPKPAYHAVKNLTTLLSDPGSTFETGKLDYRLSNTDSSTRDVLLQKRDGTFWLALWQESSVWDEVRMSSSTPADRTVTVTLPSGSDINTYSPNRGVAPTAQADDVSSINVRSSEEVTLVEIDAGVGPVEPTTPPEEEPVTTDPGSDPEDPQDVDMPNLLADASATLEGASASDTVWRQRSGGATSAPVVTDSGSLVIDGSGSLLRTKDGSSSTNWDPWQSTVGQGDAVLPVSAGNTYTFRADLRLPDAQSTARAVIEFFDGSGRPLGSGTAVGAKTSVGSSPRVVTVTGTAPSEAADARVFHRIDSMAAHTRVVGDRFSFHEGTDTTFGAPTTAPPSTTTPTTAPPSTTTPTTAPPSATAPPPTTTPTTAPPSTTAPPATGSDPSNLLDAASAMFDPASDVRDLVWIKRSSGGSGPEVTDDSRLVISGTKSLLQTKRGASATNWDPWQSTLHKRNPLPVTPGSSYTFGATLRLPDSASGIRAVIEWVDGSGRMVGGATVRASTSVGDAPQELTVTGTAPAGAAGARVFHRIDSMTSGARVVGDGFFFHAG